MAITLSGGNVTITGGYDNGTISSVIDDYNIIDSSKAWTSNEIVGKIIYITSGASNEIITSGPIQSHNGTDVLVKGGFILFNKTTKKYSNYTLSVGDTYTIAYNFQDIANATYMDVYGTGPGVTYKTKYPLINQGFIGDYSKTIILEHIYLQYGIFEGGLFNHANTRWQFGYISRDTFKAYSGCSFINNYQVATVLSNPSAFLSMSGGRFKNFAYLSAINAAFTDVDVEMYGVGGNAYLNSAGSYRGTNILLGEFQANGNQEIKGLNINGGFLVASYYFIGKDIKTSTITFQGGAGDNFYITNPINTNDRNRVRAFLLQGKLNHCTSVDLNMYDDNLNSLGDIKYHVEDIDGNPGLLTSIGADPFSPTRSYNIATDVNGNYTGTIDEDGEALVIFEHSENETGENGGDITIKEYGPFVSKAGKYGYKSQKKNITYETATVENLYFQVNDFISASKATAGTYSSKISINGDTKTITITSNTSLQELYDYSQYWFFDSDNMKYDEPLLTNDGNNFSSDYELIINNCNLTQEKFIDLGNKELTFVGTGDTESTIKYNSGTYTSITLNNLQTNSEVRIYKVSDDTEVFGIENTGTSISYKYTWTSDEPVYVMIHHIQYNHIKLDISLIEGKTSIPIQQQYDRNYSNP